GTPVTLSDPNSSQPTFTAPDVGLDGTSLTFQLTVVDTGGLQATDTCIVNVSWVNVPPTADAGPDQAVTQGTTVTLNGSNSSDPDDGIASYFWEQTAGTPVTLSDPNSSQPTFTAPDAGL
ncbi:MAG: peptidase C1A papain, partial [Proteobacteria bacterium]|nr:peptidase C1A papain [Pseudomonadota bacterium]